MISFCCVFTEIFASSIFLNRCPLSSSVTESSGTWITHADGVFRMHRAAVFFSDLHFRCRIKLSPLLRKEFALSLQVNWSNKLINPSTSAASRNRTTGRCRLVQCLRRWTNKTDPRYATRTQKNCVASLWRLSEAVWASLLYVCASATVLCVQRFRLNLTKNCASLEPDYSRCDSV